MTTFLIICWSIGGISFIGWIVYAIHHLRKPKFDLTKAVESDKNWANIERRIQAAKDEYSSKNVWEFMRPKAILVKYADGECINLETTRTREVGSKKYFNPRFMVGWWHIKYCTCKNYKGVIREYVTTECEVCRKKRERKSAEFIKTLNEVSEMLGKANNSMTGKDLYNCTVATESWKNDEPFKHHIDWEKAFESVQSEIEKSQPIPKQCLGCSTPIGCRDECLQKKNTQEVNKIETKCFIHKIRYAAIARRFDEIENYCKELLKLTQ